MAKWIHVDEAKAYRRIVKVTVTGGAIAPGDQPYSRTEKVLRIDEPKVLMGIRIWVGFPNTGTTSHVMEGGIRIADRPIFTREDFEANPDAFIYAWVEPHIHRYVESGGGHGEAVIDTKSEFWFDSPIKILLEEGDMIYINRHIAGGTDTWGGFIVEFYFGEKG